MSQKMSAFIEDGFDADGYVAEVPRLHPACAFTFRPATTEEKGELSDALNKAEGTAASNRILHQFTADHLRGWDLVDSKGNKRPHSFENVRRVLAPLIGKIASVISGVMASDVNPAWNEEQTKQAEQEKAAERDGKDVTQHRQDEREKNS